MRSKKLLSKRNLWMRKCENVTWKQILNSNNENWVSSFSWIQRKKKTTYHLNLQVKQDATYWITRKIGWGHSVDEKSLQNDCAFKCWVNENCEFCACQRKLKPKTKSTIESRPTHKDEPLQVFRDNFICD